MTPITLHTVPSTVYDRLAQDVIVSRLQPNGRFTDTYVADLVDGDQFYLPEKELPMATDTEILDFLIKNKGSWSWTITDLITGESSVHAFKVSDLTKLAERRFKTGDTPALLGAFRELFSELIHNEEL